MRSLFRPNSLVILSIAFSIAVASAPDQTDFGEGPVSGDVFREYVHDPGSWIVHINRNNPFTLKIDDLKDAVKAEMCVEYWGGHWGTHQIRFIVNDKPDRAVYVPLPKNYKGNPNQLYRTMLGNAPVPFPLDLIKEGDNKFELTWSPTRLYKNPDFPNSWIYSITVRVYYPPDKKPHPTGKLVAPKSGEILGDNPVFQASVGHTNGKKIKRVDYIGDYEDFDWEGNGLFRQWHYRTQKGKIGKHIGVGGAPPAYRCSWYNKWIPDPAKPIRVMARIMDEDGVYYMTEAAVNLRLERKRKVEMLTIARPEYPYGYCTLLGNKTTAKLHYKSKLDKATEAKLFISTWSAIDELKAGTIILVNGDTIVHGFGKHHMYSQDKFPVKLSTLRKTTGHCIVNVVNNGKKGHACEINYPGPVLMIAFPHTPGIERNANGHVQENPNRLRIMQSGGDLRFTIGGNKDCRLVVHDLSGRRIRFHHITGQERTFQTTLATPGVYFAMLTSEVNGFTRKIVVVE